MKNSLVKSQKEALLSIPDEKVNRPTMPVAYVVQMVENLEKWAKKNQKALIKTGLKVAFFNELYVKADLFAQF